jgi:hypothetical protein
MKHDDPYSISRNFTDPDILAVVPLYLLTEKIHNDRTLLQIQQCFYINLYFINHITIYIHIWASYITYWVYTEYICLLIKMIINDVAAALLEPPGTEVWLKQWTYQTYFQLHIQLAFGAPTTPPPPRCVFTNPLQQFHGPPWIHSP